MPHPVMGQSTSSETQPGADQGKCLARSVTEVLAEEPALEAVTPVKKLRLEL